MDPINEQHALEIARDTARDEYGDLKDYEMSTDETESEWRIRFQLPGAPEDGGSSHFAVWVNKASGQVRLFKGR